MHRLSWNTIITCVCFWVAPAPIQAQQAIDYTTNVHQELISANRFISMNRTDSAEVLLSALIAQATHYDFIDAHLGLSIRLSYAYNCLYTQNHLSLSLLLQLVDDCKAAEAHTLLAHAYLHIALIHELLLEQEKCLHYLDQVRLLLATHQLTTVYARYAVRRSSYHLQLTENRDSAYHYAQQAVAYVEGEAASKTKGDAYYLWGKLNEYPSHAAQLAQYMKVADVYRDLNNQVVLTWTLTAAAKSCYLAEDVDTGIRYTDSIELLLQDRSLYNEYDYIALKQSSAEIRAALFKLQGQFDSAWHYLQMSHELDRASWKLDNADAIAKIQLQYNNEKQLAAKDRVIQSRRDRERWLIVIFLTIAIATTLLMYYAFRLQKVHRTTIVQAAKLTETNSRLAEALQHQIILQGEVHHRVKNNLQIIIGLLELQTEEIEDTTAVQQLETMSSRIYSMAAVHEMLYHQQGGATVKLDDYLKNLCGQMAQIGSSWQPSKFELRIVDELFNLATAMPIGLIVNELLTNSFKYAQRYDVPLRIEIQVKREADGYQLLYRDNGTGFPKHQLKERPGGLGTYILKNMIRQLNGHFSTYNDGGAVYDIYFKSKETTRIAYSNSAGQQL